MGCTHLAQRNFLAYVLPGGTYARPKASQNFHRSERKLSTGTLPIIVTWRIPIACLLRLQHEGLVALIGCRERIAHHLTASEETRLSSSKCASLLKHGFCCGQRQFAASNPILVEVYGPAGSQIGSCYCVWSHSEALEDS